MPDTETASTAQNCRIPVMGVDLMKEALTTASRRKGVSVAKIVRKAVREAFERDNNCLICPACWEVIGLNSRKEPKWHTHRDMKVTGDMWW